MVRPATVDDAGAVARVQVETWRAAYAHAIPADTLANVDVGRRADHWRESIGSGRSATFVGRLGEAVVGFVNVGASEQHPGLGELFAIYVRPDAWGTGVATTLIERGEEELRSRGFASVVLNVLADNPRARRFYERQGWTADPETFEDEFLGQKLELVRYRKQLA